METVFKDDCREGAGTYSLIEHVVDVFLENCKEALLNVIVGLLKAFFHEGFKRDVLCFVEAQAMI